MHWAAALALAAALATAALAQAPPPTVDVVGLDGKVTAVSMAKITRHQANANDHGAETTVEGVLLKDVLAAAGVAFGDDLKGPALARYVVAVGRDGYRALFSLAEIDPSFTDSFVMVIDVRDRKRLGPEAGPLQVVAPFEQKAGRWVRQLARLEVREAP